MQRTRPHFALTQKISLAALETCPSNPARARAHPATVLERALLSLSDDKFNEIQPEHSRKIKHDTPAKTGISWIDDAESRLYEGG